MSFPIAALLPHLQRYGGVRRFIELGNEFIKRGYPYTIYLPQRELKRAKEYPWNYMGRLSPFEKINPQAVLLLGHPRSPCTNELPKFKNNIYMYVIAGGTFIKDYQKLKKYPFVLNNRVFLKEFPDARIIEGGVNTNYWRPKRLKLIYHGAKGSKVEEKLSKIPFLKLIPLKDLDDKALLKAYQEADWFVSWEERPGWANMAAEALSCGCPVVSNGVNTQPINHRVIVVKDLKEFFLETISSLSWEKVADQWEEIFREDGLFR